MGKGLQLITSGLMLLVGGMTYLLFRPTTLVLFQLLHRMGMEDWTMQWREKVAGLHLPEFVVYSLPDGFWAAAYVMVIHALLQGQSAKTRLIAASVIPLIGTVAEGMQALGWAPGTFDVADIVCMLAPLAIYAAYIYKQSFNI
ncbi:MAG: hypothetical protein J5529_02270 [Prevotella sp.]|nr:hypothetical protein [Prevotella sp.]